MAGDPLPLMGPHREGVVSPFCQPPDSQTDPSGQADQPNCQRPAFLSFPSCPFRLARPSPRLNDEALAFWHYIRPTQIEHNVRGYVIDLITACVHRAYHDAKVHVFGSYRTGLYLPYGWVWAY